MVVTHYAIFKTFLIFYSFNFIYVYREVAARYLIEPDRRPQLQNWHSSSSNHIKEEDQSGTNGLRVSGTMREKQISPAYNSRHTTMPITKHSGSKELVKRARVKRDTSASSSSNEEASLPEMKAAFEEILEEHERIRKRVKDHPKQNILLYYDPIAKRHFFEELPATHRHHHNK